MAIHDLYYHSNGDDWEIKYSDWDAGKLFCCCAECCYFKLDDTTGGPEYFPEANLAPSVYVTIYDSSGTYYSAEFPRVTGTYKYVHPDFPEVYLEPDSSPDRWKLTVGSLYVAYSKCLYNDTGAPCYCNPGGTAELVGITNYAVSAADPGPPFALESASGLSDGAAYPIETDFGSWSHTFSEDEPEYNSGYFSLVYACTDEGGEAFLFNFVGIKLTRGDGGPMGPFESWVFQGNFCKPDKNGEVTLSNIIGAPGAIHITGLAPGILTGYVVTDLYHEEYNLEIYFEGDTTNVTVHRSGGCRWESEDGEHFITTNGIDWFADGLPRSSAPDGTPVGEYEDGSGRVVTITEI